MFRNSDAEFDKLLQKESADRRIEVAAQLHETENGFTLSYTDENGNTGSAQLSIAKEIARTEQYNNICNQISKLGNTCFAISDINIDLSDNYNDCGVMLYDLENQEEVLEFTDLQVEKEAKIDLLDKDDKKNGTKSKKGSYKKAKKLVQN